MLKYAGLNRSLMPPEHNALADLLCACHHLWACGCSKKLFIYLYASDNATRGMVRDVREALARPVSDGGNACSLSGHFCVLVPRRASETGPLTDTSRRRSATRLKKLGPERLKLRRNMFMFTRTAQWRQLSVSVTP
jgi:hypothetical protein